MSWWSNFDPTVLDRAQSELIARSEVPVVPQCVRISKSTQLFCLKCGDPSKPPLVLIHGYCGSGIVFFKILKALTQEYYVILLDLLGMGRSSRPQFTCKTVPDSEAFFTESIEAFRSALDLTNFVLVGHSFGGYIAGCYSIAYPEHVAKLVLLSAVGVAKTPSQYSYIKSLDERNWKFRWLMKFVVYFWAKDITPLALLRKSGPLAAKLVHFYSKHRILGLDPGESEIVADYLQQINLLPESGELALAYIMEPGAWAKHPLCKRLKGLNKPIAFFFGDQDWVSQDGIDQVRQSNSSKVLVSIVPNSGHHLYFDNPRELAVRLLDVLHNLDD